APLRHGRAARGRHLSLVRAAHARRRGRSAIIAPFLIQIGDSAMTRIFSFAAAIVILGSAVSSAQVQPPPAPWRGAGPTPCVGSDGGVYKCAPAPRTVAIRAGRLFDSTTGQMLTRRVIVITGDRITEVGAEGAVKIP